MKLNYPVQWNWNAERRPVQLLNWHIAPDDFGFYEIGYKGNSFEPKYGGRAAGTTIRQRLRKHFCNSHNVNIRKNRMDLWFRYKVFKSDAVAQFVEAVHITAFEYEWNGRNEWFSHWALE